jgi:hypothetical protein
VVAPLVPTAVEVDPETPVPVAPLRFVPIAPSFVGLPLRLTCALGAGVVLLAELLLAEAFDRIHPPVFTPAADALADGLCAMPLPGMMHPVSVICCGAVAAREDDGVRLRVVVVCPVRLEGVDGVVVRVPDVCG